MKITDRKVLAALFVIILSIIMTTGCSEQKPKKSQVDDIIKEAQTMTLEQLAKKAIEESKGKAFFGLGNSSRGKDAIPKFIKYLQKIDPSYNLSFEWQQPKNNKIYDQLIADAAKEKGTFAMTLIQDGTQFKPKMLATGFLKRFVPLEWAKAKNITNLDEYNGYVPLLMISKVFEYNCRGDMAYTNCWDFVYKGVRPLFMYAATETVGMNFLYMLTSKKYSDILKKAYDKLPPEKQGYFEPIITSMEKEVDELKKEITDKDVLHNNENAKYALAWIKLWMDQYNGQTDDGPICNILINESAKNKCGLLVYSKLRSVVESDKVSLNNLKVAAYEDDYIGIGGYGYCHYLFVTDNSPLPWTACALISYLTTQQDGFEAWGKDMGCYSSNPLIDAENEKIHKHKNGGYKDKDKNKPLLYAVKNDKGKDWWENPEQGCLVLEDPEYCTKVAFTIGRWIDLLAK